VTITYPLSTAVQSGVPTGWKKHLQPEERRALALAAHGGDQLSAAKSLMALSNVTTDRATQKAARADALYFYHRHSVVRAQEIHAIRPLRITAKMPLLR